MPPVDEFLSRGWMNNASPTLKVDCLLPTGVIIPLMVETEDTIEDIKGALWIEAQTYPLYTNLRAKHTYVFQCITFMAEKVELEDETQRLGDVKPFQPILKVVERKGNKVEKIANLHISMLIGKGLHEFDNLKSAEVSDFRQNMRRICEEIATERDNQPWLSRMKFLYPPDISDRVAFPGHIREKLTNQKVFIHVWMADIDTSYTFQIPCSTKPAELINMAINKRLSQTGINLGESEKFVLKVCGYEELMLGDYPMSQFMCIQRWVMKGTTPSVLLIEKAAIQENDSKTIVPKIPAKAQRNPNTAKSGKMIGKASPNKGTSSWDVKDKYSFSLHSVTNINETNFSKLQLCACIYHGPDAMCDVVKSSDVMVNEGCVNWDEELTFDISLDDIPRMSRLCFVLSCMGDKRTKDKRHPTGGKKKGRREISMPLSWVNISMFDYQDILRSGPCKLYMWSVSDDETLSDQESMLNPIGTVENNPMAGGAVCLSLSFHDFNVPSPIYFAPFEKVLEVAASHTDFSKMTSDPLDSSQSRIQKHVSTIMLDEKKNVNQQHLKQLQQMVDRDPLTELCDQEIEKIWLLRFECQYHFPHSLPKLLRCVKWNNHLDVAQMQALLQIWPLLKPVQALELLDFDYANKAVRSFAVKCLKEMSDLQLTQYLLQLVQVLKYESYLECDLVHFLLERALNNRRIGHSLFWLLRSEMHVPSVSVRFGLILEAYCRGSAGHIASLSKQTMTLDKLKTLGLNAKNEKKEKAKETLKIDLEKPLIKEAMSDLQSILDPRQKLKSPKRDKCNVMDSKMRPLWLVFDNSDLYGEKIYMMYKNGDDLRQDMLTLQILRIIDNIWQEAGLDLRLNAYGCLSTGHDEGLIEIVTGSDTIANIQKKYPGLKLKSAFNKQSLYQWLKKNNNTDENLEKAMDEFTSSCAGYSVAMYVLGVGDRHGDNILLKKNGQLFHIDFGHFLGHFKSKFGVNREPAPFMLTSEFVFLIQRGPKKDNAAFEKFKVICEKAYMALREKSNFLITLFLMMINTGIPELSCQKDIEYLRSTLVPQVSEDEAREHFRKQMNVALKNAWKVAVNNTFHNMMRDNAQ